MRTKVVARTESVVDAGRFGGPQANWWVRVAVTLPHRVDFESKYYGGGQVAG